MTFQVKLLFVFADSAVEHDWTVADPEEGPWGPLTPPFEVNFIRLN